MRAPALVLAACLVAAASWPAPASAAELWAAPEWADATVGLLALPSWPYSRPSSSPSPEHANVEGFEASDLLEGLHRTCTHRGCRCPNVAVRLLPTAPFPQPALMDALCAASRLNCSAVAVYSIADREAAVVDGTVDLFIGLYSYTAQRANSVHFVRPFYGASGLALFSDTEQGRALEGSLQCERPNVGGDLSLSCPGLPGTAADRCRSLPPPT